MIACECPTRVADVVRQRPHCEREFIGVACIAEKIDDEITGADIVGKVGERLVSEGIVANVLDNATAVRVGSCMLQLFWSECWIAAEKERNNRVASRKDRSVARG